MSNDLETKPQYAPDSAMAALPSDKQRMFVENLFELATINPGHGLATRAARAAGYEASTPHVLANVARNLKNDPRVQAAIAEMTKQRIRDLGPKAIAGLTTIISSPHNSKQLNAILAVLDRIDNPVQRIEVEHNVKVDHTAEAVAQLRLLKSMNVARERLEEIFGFGGLQKFEQLITIEDQKKNVIEGEYTEVLVDPDEEELGAL